MTYQGLCATLAPMFGSGEARAIVRLVLEQRYGLTTVDIAVGKVTQLSAEQQTELQGIIKRLHNGEPVQHVLGYAEFLGRRFRVTPATLIPRPETERLTLMAVEALRRASTDTKPRLLDIGTGTGCIAITAALLCHEADVVAWDISEEALAVARENAAALGASVTFERQDALEIAATPPLCDGQRPSDTATSQAPNLRSQLHRPRTCAPRYAVIVSNPPYIRESEAREMSPVVLDHEPRTALFVPDADPLLFYRAIARYALHALMPGGTLLFEINRAFASETAHLLTVLGFTSITTDNDLYDNPRYVSALLPA